jgi:hypothetical protein
MVLSDLSKAEYTGIILSLEKWSTTAGLNLVLFQNEHCSVSGMSKNS